MSHTPSWRSVAGLPPRVFVVCAILFVAALAFYATAWRGAQVIDGDSPQYMEVARDLADFRLDTLHDRTLGYPLLLALTGSFDHPTWALLVVSLVLHFASAWLLAVLLHAGGVPDRWLLAFCVVLALPPLAEPAAWVMTENLAQFGLVAAVAGLVFGLVRSRARWVAVAGLSIGCLGLTRPVYLLLAPALSAVFVCASFARGWTAAARRTTRTAAAVLLVASGLVLAAMSAFNGVRFGYLGITPLAGFHLTTKVTTFIERLPPEYAAVREVLVRERDKEITARGGTHTGTQTIWRSKDELMAMTGLTKPELSAYLLRMDLALIRRAPIEYLQEVGRSMALYWFPAPTPAAAFGSTALRWLWTLLHVAILAGFFLEAVVLIGVGAFRLSVRGHGAGLLVPWLGITAAQAWAYAVAGAVVVYTALLTCFLDIGEPRQRRPTDVLLVFLVVLGAWVWRRAVARASTDE